MSVHEHTSPGTKRRVIRWSRRTDDKILSVLPFRREGELRRKGPLSPGQVKRSAFGCPGQKYVCSRSLSTNHLVSFLAVFLHVALQISCTPVAGLHRAVLVNFDDAEPFGHQLPESRRGRRDAASHLGLPGPVSVVHCAVWAVVRAYTVQEEVFAALSATEQPKFPPPPLDD